MGITSIEITFPVGVEINDKEASGPEHKYLGYLQRPCMSCDGTGGVTAEHQEIQRESLWENV